MREVVEKLSKDALVDIIDRLAKGERIEHVLADQIPTQLQSAVTMIHLCRCRKHGANECTWYDEKDWKGTAHDFWLSYVRLVMEDNKVDNIDNIKTVADHFAVLSGQILVVECEMKGHPSMQSALRRLLIDALEGA